MREELDCVLRCDVLVHQTPIVVSGGLVVAVVVGCVCETALLHLLLYCVLRSEVHLPLGKALVAARQSVVSIVARLITLAILLPEVSFNKNLFQIEFEVRVSDWLQSALRVSLLLR